MDQNVRVCTSTHRVIACRRTTITPIGPSATLYYGDPGTAPCNWKLTQEKRIFPATTILMCFIINYHFAINSVYQGGGSNWKSQMNGQKGIPTKVWHKTKITLFFWQWTGLNIQKATDLNIKKVNIIETSALEPGQLAAVAGRPQSSIEVASFAWADLGALGWKLPNIEDFCPSRNVLSSNLNIYASKSKLKNA